MPKNSIKGAVFGIKDIRQVKKNYNYTQKHNSRIQQNCRVQDLNFFVLCFLYFFVFVGSDTVTTKEEAENHI